MKIWRSAEKYRRKLKSYRENYAAEWIQQWEIFWFPRQAKRKGSYLTYSQMEFFLSNRLIPVFSRVAHGSPGLQLYVAMYVAMCAHIIRIYYPEMCRFSSLYFLV